MPAKAGAAALKGHDDEGTDFETPEEMWDAELAGGDEKGRAAWYNKGACTQRVCAASDSARRAPR